VRLTAFAQKFLQKISAAPNNPRAAAGVWHEHDRRVRSGGFGFAGVCDPTDLRSTRDQRFAGGVAACPAPCGEGVLPDFFMPVACLVCLACFTCLAVCTDFLWCRTCWALLEADLAVVAAGSDTLVPAAQLGYSRSQPRKRVGAIAVYRTVDWMLRCPM